MHVVGQLCQNPRRVLPQKPHLLQSACQRCVGLTMVRRDGYLPVHLWGGCSSQQTFVHKLQKYDGNVEELVGAGGWRMGAVVGKVRMLGK